MTREAIARIGCLIILCLLVASPALAGQSGRDLARENAKDLVVMVEGTVGSSRQDGAGIIVGSDRDFLFIATADHVVRDIDQPIQGLSVRFHWRTEQPVPAALLPNRVGRAEGSTSEVFDLAVLRVRKSDVPPFEFDLLPLELIGNSAELERAGDLYFLGYPEGRAWYGNVTPAKFAENRGDLITFETDALLPGYSGGALLNSDLYLIGLIIDTEGAFGRAISIGSVMSTLKHWQIPVQLGERPALTFGALSTGYAFSCALTVKGLTYCWGGGAGATGSDESDTEENRAMSRVPGGLRFSSLSVGAYHACGVTNAGQGYCFGANEEGQLGAEFTGEASAYPEPVTGGLRFRSISVGRTHSCGITIEGRAYCWGENWKPRPVPVRGDGVFEAISSGHHFSCGLSKGQAWCWGWGDQGELGRAASVKSTSWVPVPIAAEPGLRLQQISSGERHSCATASDGRVLCWGNNDYGQAGAVRGSEPTILPNFKFLSVSAGDESTCGISLTHSVLCWGNASYGALGGGWTKVIKNQVIEDEIHEVPVPVAGGHKFRLVSTGLGFFACGVTDRQELMCWGRRHRRLMGYYGDYGTTPRRLNH